MNPRRIHIVLLLLCISSLSYAQRTARFSFDSLFARYPQAFDSIIAHRADYRLQLLYTRIDRDADNTPHLTTYSYDADKYYYYCASMMKLPACALTLEKLNNLAKYHVDMLDSLAIDSIACADLSSEAMMLGTAYSRPSQYIKEMLLVSNNNAFNPIYDFLGQYDFQERLHQIGAASAVVSNRYAGCDTTANRRCSPVSLFDIHTHMRKYEQPCIINQRRQLYQGDLSPLVGDGYLGGGSLINEPKNFRFANYIKLSELHRLLTRIILPQTQPPAEKLNLTQADYQYLYKCMGMCPRECAYPAFDSVKYPDNYMKYFMGLDSGTYTMPANIRIFNKVGQAYGFMTDCSYVMDTLHKVEFFLSCAMYLNADGILNDGKYEYDQIGFPFFHDIFNAVYNEELTRHKEYLPRLRLPDFTDTLLVKPGPPAWQKIDTNMSAEKMEAVLYSLADSMWQDRKLYINYDNPTADEIFLRNLTIALRRPATAAYPFDALRQKNIAIITSDDKKLRVFSWDKDAANANYALFQFTDSGRVYLRKPTDFLSNESQPKLIYNKLYQVKAKTGTIYLLSGQTSAGTGGAEYLQSYGWHANRPARLKVFKVNPKKDTLYDAILVEKKSPKDAITYDSKHKTIAYPLIVKSGKKFKTQVKKLKFDGVVFRP